MTASLYEYDFLSQSAEMTKNERDPTRTMWNFSVCVEEEERWSTKPTELFAKHVTDRERGRERDDDDDDDDRGIVFFLFSLVR